MYMYRIKMSTTSLFHRNTLYWMMVNVLMWILGIATTANAKIVNLSHPTFVNCTSDSSTFKCLVDGVCIPRLSHCDSKVDCKDETDEKFCASKCDGKEWFRCANGHCISTLWLCDAEDDCMDWSDEANCEQEEDLSLVTDTITCQGTDFKCGDGLCIPVTWTCDGQEDCHAGTDENPKLCGTEEDCDEFTCMESGSCIPHRWVCDGSVDCPDGSDEGDFCGQERNGTASCNENQGWYPCLDASRCLQAQHVCDSNPQCADGSDEGPFCSRKPDCSSSNCSYKCMNTPSGATCYCPSGYTLDTDDECVDIDECEVFGSCSQNCLNTIGSFNCSCVEGYTMQNGSCVASFGEPILFFSTKNDVRGLRVQSMEYFPVASNLPYVIGVGFDSVDARVYWTDVEAGKETLVSAGFYGNGIKDVVNNGLDMPEDLVVDELNRNIYLTDSVRKHIAVCAMDGRGCSILVSGVEQPRALAIHYKSRQVLYTDWGSEPSVTAIAMDGSNTNELVKEDIIWPNGLAVDQVLDRVYWSDAKKDRVESVFINGTGRMTILDTVAKHPFSLAVFEDTLYWSDWEMQEIVSCNKFTGKNFKTLVKEAGIHPMGITISHPLMTPVGFSPCINSPCSHVCLANPSGSYTCACPPDFYLSASGTQCKELPNSSKLLFSTSSLIYSLHPQTLGLTSYSPSASLSLSSTITSMSASGVDGNIYLVTGDTTAKILHLNINTGKTKVVLSGTQFGSVTYDPLSANMFWVDVNKKSIMVYSMATKSTQEVYVGTSSPHYITFIPEKNRLLVAETGKVSVVKLGDITTEVFSQRLLLPTSLVYCSLVDAVFIGDSRSRAIFKWDWNSDELVPFLENIGEVASMAEKDSLLYWVERTGTTLLWTSVLDSKDLSWLALNTIASPNDLLHLTISANKTTYSHSNMDCINAHCSHLCYNKDSTGHTCTCPYGMRLSKNKITCQEDCAENVFRCGDGQCIPSEWKCDGTADCEDESDETDCTIQILDSCNNETQTACDDGACILSSWLCDGDADCPDNSDENDDCPDIDCGEGRFLCANMRQCILTHWKCDGGVDCTDGSDEEDCEVNCSSDQFQCKDKKLCIESGWVCDGNADCHDGSDEEQCTETLQECSRTEFSCSNGNCVSMELMCNGENDCGDGSDEEDDICQTHEDPLVETALCLGELVCGQDCLPMSARCNGSFECVDESDEKGCSLCTKDTFSCTNGERCIPMSWVCDTATDCSDGSDEVECGMATTVDAGRNCQTNQFECSSGECISLHLACNNRPDCLDGSDEGLDECDAACIDNGGCPQSCSKTPRGPACRCNPGYNLTVSEGSLLCLDLDECAEITTCSQHCTNTKGSYKCSCATGYTSEGRYCRAGGEPPKLMYAVHNKINGVMKRPGNTFRVDLEFTSHDVTIKSFDYSPTTREFYWSSPVLGVIGRYNTDTGLSTKNEVWMNGIERPDQVVVDWITGNVYFSQQSSSIITVCAKVAKSTHCTHICQVPVDFVTLMKVDPREGRLFVAGYSRVNNGYPSGAIYPYSMDGGLVAEADLIGSPKTGIPSGLALDTITRRVYWSDLTSKDISVCNYEGRNCQIVVSSLQGHLNFLAFYESQLYWLAGEQGYIYTHDILSQETSYRYDLTLPTSSHSLKFVHSSIVPTVTYNPCLTLNCSSLCLLTLSSARCGCPLGTMPLDSQTKYCLLPNNTSPKTLPKFTGVFPYPNDITANRQDIAIEAMENTDDNKGVAIAVPIVLVLLGALVAFFYTKYRQTNMKPELGLMFSNLTYGNEVCDGQARQEFSAVHIVERGSGLGIDNPGFDSPADLNLKSDADLKYSTIDWSHTDQIEVCEGSSTPTRSRTSVLVDSAYHEASIASSIEDNRHFSVCEDDESFEQNFSMDKQKLLN